MHQFYQKSGVTRSAISAKRIVARVYNVPQDLVVAGAVDRQHVSQSDRGESESMGRESADALALARMLRDQKVDVIDGLAELGRLLSGLSVFDPGPGNAYAPEVGLLIHMSDELDAVPTTAQRSVWNPEAFDDARAAGERIIEPYQDDLGAALGYVVDRLEGGIAPD